MSAKITENVTGQTIKNLQCAGLFKVIWAATAYGYKAAAAGRQSEAVEEFSAAVAPQPLPGSSCICLHLCGFSAFHLPHFVG
ncbi:MAG: hypothetical protein Q4F57_01860 [Weeksellaceae bacterium]|nr:hypothetical protein [Weeksellaceae bacterium]